ncbi:phosphopantetheine-binding protein [Streptomyces sp. NPDC097981]|uniref:phosphopantetheine-binding protein n=1 Tax=Streptomyces sp. NPDC097981 TaxID=3155428 RepID=UPI00331ED808
MSETTNGGTALDEALGLILEWSTELLEEPTASEDNFLDLGGHSALALELNDRIKERFHVEADMQILFERSLGEVAASVVRTADASVKIG